MRRKKLLGNVIALLTTAKAVFVGMVGFSLGAFARGGPVPTYPYLYVALIGIGGAGVCAVVIGRTIRLYGEQATPQPERQDYPSDIVAEQIDFLRRRQ